ncbi:MAG: helix-hairpin-helix domain-containing protein [Clostridiales Family XIII bacterium]|jgi:competence protein ComEA|nr:helix-hairpin-helix domain-containing protein [Clostridiales Family XIII bacterium]
MKKNLVNIYKKIGLKKILIAFAIFIILIFTITNFLGKKEKETVISTTSKEIDKIETTDEVETKTEIFIDVQGEVKNPGVYAIVENSRIFEIIKKAGGLKKGADISNINRAKVLIDGEKIYIPKKSETNNGTGTMETENNLININTATSTELQEINGVGPATAEKIITYREQEGGFKKLEDLLNVSGIGEKTFEKLKAFVCI